MVDLTFDRKQVEEAVRAIVERTMRMDMTWDWPCGVAYYGICQAYEATKEQRYLDLVRERVDEYLEIGLPAWTVNTCSMGHCCLSLYQHTGEKKYLDVVLSKVDYLRNHALRFGDNVLQHTVSDNNDFPEQAWADTLFMAAFFLLRAGVELKDEALIDDALNQYYWHIKYLQDPATGLYYHGYNNITGDHMSGFYWGRANAWAAYTMSQVGVRLPEAYLYPKFLDVVGSLNDQLAALKLCQTENGLWRTILDDPESYEEISASCGIAAAMITKSNPLHMKYINKAIPGVLANISSDGRVMNVSGGTAVMKDRDGYRNISRDWIQGWGQGLALAFLTGVLTYGQSEGATAAAHHTRPGTDLLPPGAEQIFSRRSLHACGADSRICKLLKKCLRAGRRGHRCVGQLFEPAPSRRGLS